MIGTKLANRYEILRELGRGGMGAVYLARDPLLDRDVAIKILSPNMVSAESSERFRREARMVAKLDHPGIVAVHDIGEHNGGLFFVMAYVQGASLRNYLDNASLNFGELLEIGALVADALEFSHTRGVIHRDIKPENILVVREVEGLRARVTDFGLAIASRDHRLTQSGSFVGTVSYLSPEQVSGKGIDTRSDLYSLGIVLYECLAGQPPFTGEVLSVLLQIASEKPRGLRELGAQVDDDIESFIMQCLEKDPALRPQRARDVAEMLRDFRSRLGETDRERVMFSAYRAETIQSGRPVMPTFVGREKEFAELQLRLNAAISGECQFVVVSGEAGIGKSRLLDELGKLARAKEIRLLHGRFVEQENAFPYQAFCEAIQGYFHLKTSTHSSTPPDFSDLAPDLTSLFPVLAEEISTSQKVTVMSESARVHDRTYIFDLLARAFLRIGSGKPLVILFEDLHYGEMSIDALQYIVRRLGPTPTLVVTTYRSTEVDRHHPLVRMMNSFQGDSRFIQIQLGPLSASEHRAFLKAIIGSPNLEEDFVQKLYEATEGNPHFLRELVRSLLDSGRIIKTETGSLNLSGEGAVFSDALPPNIQQTIEKRIERLPEFQREILTLASILGKTFEFGDLEILIGRASDLDDAVDRLISAGFLEEERGRGDRLAYSSGIVRDVLYANIAKRKRRSLHRKYAEELEKLHANHLERYYPQLVHHYSEGEVSEKVIEYGLELARRSLRAFSAQDVLRAGRAVLDFLQDETGTLPGEVRLLMAEAHRMSGNIETALQELEESIRIFEKCGDWGRAAGAIAAAAEAAWDARKVEQTRHLLDKGLSAARLVTEPETLARLLSLGARVENLRGEHDKATQYLEELEQLKPMVLRTAETVPSGGTLVVGISQPVAAQHPAQARTTEEAEVLANVFETLVKMDDEGHPVPRLCESWEELGEGKTFLFTIRSGVRLHDGSELTADMVRESMERAIRLSWDRLPAAFTVLNGVSDFLSGATNQVAGISVQASNRLLLELQTPLHIYPAFLTDYRSSISIESDAPYPIGSGPFQISSFQPSQAVLARNSNYWGDASRLDGIEFPCGIGSAEMANRFRSGNLDVAGSLLPQDFEQILQDRRLRAGVVETTRRNTYYAVLSGNCELGKWPEFRKAFCGIVRANDLVRGMLGRLAQPAEGLLPPGILGHDPARRHQPLIREKAVELLQKTGLTPPLHLKAAVHPVYQDTYSAFLKALLKTWADVGIEVSIETPNIASFLQSTRQESGLDLYIGRWTADYDDPDSFAFGIFHSAAGTLRKVFSSPEMDTLIERARGESSPVLRDKLYRKLENLLIESGHFLPLFHEIDYRVRNPRIRGMMLHSSPPFVNYSALGKAEEEAPAAMTRTPGGILHIPSTGDIPNMDPSLTITAWQQEINPAVFETLTQVAEGARVVPWLAEEFRAEQGGKSFWFRLRDDVRFHDGRKLSARDVRYSFEHLLHNGDPASSWVLDPVQGAKELLRGEGTLRGFKILSSLEFRIDLEEPVLIFPLLLAFTTAAIIPEGTMEFRGGWRDGCIGTGPFRVVRFDPTGRIELEANPYYWRPGYPKADGLILFCGVSPPNIASGFLSGRFSLAWDLLRADVETLRHEPEYASRYHETPSLSTYMLVFNCHRGPLADEELRRQFVEMVDVAGLVKRNAGRLAIPAGGLIPPGLLGYEPFRSSRPASVSSRWRTGDNIELNCMAHSIFEGPYAPVAQELFGVLRRLRLQPLVVEKKSEYASVKQLASTVDINFTRWIADYPDADAFTYGMLHSQKGLHGTFCGTPEVDKLIEQGRSESDPSIRHHIYREIEEIIARRALLLPLFHEQTYRFARPEVQNFEYRHSYPTVAYENLWIRR